LLICSVAVWKTRCLACSSDTCSASTRALAHDLSTCSCCASVNFQLPGQGTRLPGNSAPVTPSAGASPSGAGELRRICSLLVGQYILAGFALSRPGRPAPWPAAQPPAGASDTGLGRMICSTCSCWRRQLQLPGQEPAARYEALARDPATSARPARRPTARPIHTTAVMPHDALTLVFLLLLDEIVSMFQRNSQIRCSDDLASASDPSQRAGQAGRPATTAAPGRLPRPRQLRVPAEPWILCRLSGSPTETIRTTCILPKNASPHLRLGKVVKQPRSRGILLVDQGLEEPDGDRPPRLLNNPSEAKVREAFFGKMHVRADRLCRRNRQRQRIQGSAGTRNCRGRGRRPGAQWSPDGPLVRPVEKDPTRWQIIGGILICELRWNMDTISYQRSKPCVRRMGQSQQSYVWAWQVGRRRRTGRSRQDSLRARASTWLRGSWPGVEVTDAQHEQVEQIMRNGPCRCPAAAGEPAGQGAGSSRPRAEQISKNVLTDEQRTKFAQLRQHGRGSPSARRDRSRVTTGQPGSLAREVGIDGPHTRRSSRFHAQGPCRCRAGI